MAFLATQGRDCAVAAHDAEESFLPIARGSRPFQAFDGVVGDEIDLGGKTQRMARQLVRLLIAVVHSGDEDVFKHQALLLRDVEVTGLEQNGERVFAVHWHDLTPHLVGRAVERNRETKLRRLGCQFADLRGEPAGRDGDVPRTDLQPPGRIDNPDGAQQVR